MNSLPDQNAELVYQGIRLIRALPADAYASEPSDATGSPAVGPHFRHCLDFYLCFLDGLERQVVDYDARCRRAAVERDRETAVSELAAVAERLGRIDESALSEPIELCRETSDADSERQLLHSTVGRELQFLASHTVHHYALIALALRLEGHPVPSEFGVAPSTLEHWRREGQVAR